MSRTRARSPAKRGASASARNLTPETTPTTGEEGRRRDLLASDHDQSTRRAGFGGPVGQLLIIVGSHLFIPLALFVAKHPCYHAHRDRPGVSYSALSVAREFFDSIVEVLTVDEDGWWRTRVPPAALIYFVFVALQAFLAVYLPGARVNGMPLSAENMRSTSCRGLSSVKSEARGDGGKYSLPYLCNGIESLGVSVLLAVLLHVTGLLPLHYLLSHDLHGAFLFVSMVAGDLAAVAVWAWAKFGGYAAGRETGSVVSDVFLGVFLNPRIRFPGTGRFLDLKLFTEARVSWTLLMFLTASAMFEESLVLGRVTGSMLVVFVGQALYAVAVAKGEVCIPSTWDIFHEHEGWMLLFWNLSGVPFFYSLQGLYLASRARAGQPVDLPWWYVAAMLFFLVASYVVWDQANGQKNRFRMAAREKPTGVVFTLELPGATLKNPKFLTTATGSTLLVDGWYGVARKIHYTSDICMALAWGLACGFDSFLPYLYVTFFTVMIGHRWMRDDARCAAKYGADWTRYTAQVPYVFVPYLL
jgi:Delta24(24(1))-sterol reductase